MTDTTLDFEPLSIGELSTEAVALLERLDLEVTGPSRDAVRMEVSLCTSTTCSSSGGIGKFD